MRTSPLWLSDPIVQAQLEAVEQLITSVACLDSASPPPFHRQLLSPRSKRLRPALVLLAARSGAATESPALVATAAGVEILHEATLYHDDIADEAVLRRGQVATHVAFGARVAACAGSELVYATVPLFADLSPQLRRRVGRTIDRLCRGQLREIETAGDCGVAVRDRLRIMRDKTAGLFALAAHVGAILGGATEMGVRAMTRFGGRFGMCFQLADDLRDLVASPELLGRSPGSDLLDGVYTLPILYVMANGGTAAGELRARLRGLLRSRDPAALSASLAALREAGGIERALETLRAWMSSARADLIDVAPVHAAARDSLESLLGWLESELSFDREPQTASKFGDDRSGARRTTSCMTS